MQEEKTKIEIIEDILEHHNNSLSGLLNEVKILSRHRDLTLDTISILQDAVITLQDSVIILQKYFRIKETQS